MIGHSNLAPALEKLPPVSLFYGPRSVGKWTAACESMESMGIAGIDQREVESLDAETARQVVSFMRIRPMHGRKGVVMQTDGATPEAFNALLKTLEEPPERTHVVLVASQRPPLTVLSRCREFRFGYLADDEVAQVLVAVFGWPLADAEAAAVRSGGQVDTALGWSKDEQTRKAPVLQVLKGTADGNVELVLNALAAKREGKDVFGQEELKLLRRWAIEAKTRRWRVFTPTEGYGLQVESKIVDRILGACASGARPKVAVRAALLPVAWDRSLAVG